MRGERLACAAAALVLGVGGAVWAGQEHEQSAPPPAGDRVMRAVEGLRDDQVHVTDDGRPMLDEKAERRIADLIAERDSPVHVLVWQDSWFAGYDHYLEAADQVLELLDEPALLVLWQGPDTSSTDVTAGWTVDNYSEEWAGAPAEPSYLGDAALRLPEWIEALPDEPLTRQTDDGAGGTGTGTFLGFLLALPALLGVWVVVGIVRVATGRRFRNRPLRPRSS